MRRPTEDIAVFAERRKRVLAKLQGSALVVASNPEYTRNASVGFAYRQDSNFYYLTGFEEPGSVLVLRPGQTPESVMFVRPRNPERETWDGFRFGPEGVEKYFGIHKALPNSDLESELPKLLKPYSEVYFRLNKNSEFDKLFLSSLEKLRLSQGRTGYGLLSIHDADVFLGEFRLIKQIHDLSNLRRACEISAQAHLSAMKFARPGRSEREVQGLLSYEFQKMGAAREGYNFIVASGSSATTLHYNFNDQICRAGDLLLIDAGAEFNYFTGDITRTFPVSGKFTEAQARVYEGVLQVQKNILSLLKPGLFFADLHKMGCELLTDLMLELGLLQGNRQELIEADQHRKYYPHGIGHWLGMDVHDAGLYFRNGEPRAIEENMCFTIEPGLYIPSDDGNPFAKKYLGIGVRIEDNVRITSDGCEVMTSSAPKEISELEKIIGTGTYP